MQMPEWKPLEVLVAGEAHPLDRQSVANHPLLATKPRAVREIKTNKVQTLGSNKYSGSNVGTADPLGAFDPLSGGGGADPLSDPLSAAAFVDPLSAPIAALAPKQEIIVNETAGPAESAAKPQKDSSSLNWSAMKARIMRDFSVTGSIRLGASAVNEFAGSGVEDGSSSKQVDRYSKRLAQLEKKAGGEDTIEFTQKECENHVQRLSRDLDLAWKNEERVKTLKITIQLARMLSDTNVPAFYPYLFVLVTNVLDRFGDMVFNRLKGRAEEALNEQKLTGKHVTLPEDFTSADVPTVAKETCRNWFFKAACIRELLPRIYVEIALLPCYRFIADSEFPAILARLGSLIRGLGSPMVATYARAYLVACGQVVAPQATQYALSVSYDTFSSFTSIRAPYLTASLTQLGLSPADYMRILSPGLDWMLKAAGKNATKEVFQGVLQHYRDKSNDGVVLCSILGAFDATHYIHAVSGMVALIRSAEGLSQSVGGAELYRALGQQLLITPPPEEQRLQVLNDVWKAVSKIESLSAFVRCAEAWMEVIMKHYSEREVLVLLGGVVSKITVAGAAAEIGENDARHLENLLRSLLLPSSTIGAQLLTSEHLLKILDIFKGGRRVDLCKDVLNYFWSCGKTSDGILIHTMFEIGRTLHDSVDLLSPEGERRQISHQLCRFIDRIDFGKDLEQQLNIYVECRAIFCNLDIVLERLIVAVAGLAMKAYKFMKGRHSKKTGAFAKACLAYCHITTPSISDVNVKLQLLLVSAQISLINQCLPQTDTFLKAAISLIPEIPPYEEVDGKRVHTEDKLATFVKSLLGTLVVTPGHPEHGPFYIVQGLRNALPRYPWQSNSTAQCRVYIDILGLLCTYSQRTFPYHIAHVESNDVLYVGSQAYLQELNENIVGCIEEILKQINAMGERTETSAKLMQSKMILDLINQILSRMLLNADVSNFVVKLFELALKNKSLLPRADIRYMQATIEFGKKVAESAHTTPQQSSIHKSFGAALRGLQI